MSFVRPVTTILAVWLSTVVLALSSPTTLVADDSVPAGNAGRRPSRQMLLRTRNSMSS